MKIPYNGKSPLIHESVFVAPGAYLIGDVQIGKDSTVWFNAVIRADDGPIIIGERCSIQDNSTIHLYEGFPVVIEDDVTIGHNVILHGCKVGRSSVVGMGSTLLDNVEVGEECIIGANTLLAGGIKIPPRSLVLGSPGKVVRELTDKDLQMLQMSSEHYVQKGKEFRVILKS
ncbi:carbonic anhydrase/acetyltransferase-like protein (isoleucine patch superfamily) [Neobacillus bataviensis]|uniref:Carbonic anhydrase/acetyltransferase-like protein (Isoleucine patch superfamily) n=1 Tax=Neobacillus bataviensis TaxID=220685 RepID=A0A561CK59_9BACI|nr:gamma carbonic anhydrase family protein [Neobacillus bataviensis]TWD91581.1 carbonic anhydrase/acetyltransferase-like protein (isoleucine patch superfamily) [Neobacillus bataviensis]